MQNQRPRQHISEEELDLQHRKREWVYIQKSSIEFALKTGKAEGKAEERIDLTKQMVCNMAKKGIEIEMIADITGLSMGKVKLILEGDNG